MMAAILNYPILYSAILDWATLVFPLKLTPSCQDWFPPLHKKNLHSFILTQFDDGSHFEFYHVGLKNFTHSFWLNLMMAAIFNSAMFDSRWLPSSSWDSMNEWNFLIKHGRTSLIHTDSTWWWQPSWILPCWIQTPCFLLSDSLQNTLTPLWLWLKLIQSD